MDFLTDKTPMQAYSKMCPQPSASSCSMVEVYTQALMLPENYLHPEFQWKSLRQSKKKVSNTYLSHFTKLKLQVAFLISEISTSESFLDSMWARLVVT